MRRAGMPSDRYTPPPAPVPLLPGQWSERVRSASATLHTIRSVVLERFRKRTNSMDSDTGVPYSAQAKAQATSTTNQNAAINNNARHGMNGLTVSVNGLNNSLKPPFEPTKSVSSLAGLKDQESDKMSMITLIVGSTPTQSPAKSIKSSTTVYESEDESNILNSPTQHPKSYGGIINIAHETGDEDKSITSGSIYSINGEAVVYATASSGEAPDPNRCNSTVGLTHNDKSSCNLVDYSPNGSNLKPEETFESPLTSLSQIIVPFLIAGLGNVAAGIVLDAVQYWPVFREVPPIIILVPALLGLKGNVEMTLASRLSTHANLGNMDSPSDVKRLIKGNMSLVQCQASVVGTIAPLVALLLAFIQSYTGTAAHHGTDSTPGIGVTVKEAVLLVSASVITANLANLILGSLMCGVILACRKYHVNPDNIATPIAASLGDFTTMLLLAGIASGLFKCQDSVPWLSSLLLAALLALTPLWAWMAWKNEFTRKVALTGWFPILGAMMLQNAGGLIMERALERFGRMAAFQPVINGIGGNLVAIQSSRMSTYLHLVADKRKLPSSDPRVFIAPYKTFFGSSPHATMARYLLLLSIPAHLVFTFIIYWIKGHIILTVLFFAFYLISTAFHVLILLYFAYILVHFLWTRGVNPDNCAIPLLTAVADLLGAALLAFAFILLHQLSDPNAAPEVLPTLAPVEMELTTPLMI